ncbi:hypothetical protein [Celeribacter sp. PS-C1]|uniref:NYN domain-containing protein n=1 Tax=Celeribacter sp. PS-C1 TaxID=2820813 RepID=UPI001CA4EFB7|nr:hypothetical protein [Celeribacter sp. PS-C1]MBW6418661.1 hypothetical protein [Celeribacter sp. PS-C1]
MSDIRYFLAEPSLEAIFGYWPFLLAIFLLYLASQFVQRRKLVRTPFAIMDGSNIMYWKDERPDLSTVRAAIETVKSKGYVPIVWFDANVGYLVSNAYLGPVRLARTLGLNAQQVKVSPKGTPADPLILRMAQQRKALVVTNDRYRDWHNDFPILRQGKVLVRGHFARGRVHLKDMPSLK